MTQSGLKAGLGVSVLVVLSSLVMLAVFLLADPSLPKPRQCPEPSEVSSLERGLNILALPVPRETRLSGCDSTDEIALVADFDSTSLLPTEELARHLEERGCAERAALPPNYSCALSGNESGTIIVDVEPTGEKTSIVAGVGGHVVIVVATHATGPMRGAAPQLSHAP